MASKSEMKAGGEENQLAEVRVEMEKRFKEMATKVDNAMEGSREVVRERPMLTLAATFVIGIILGLLLGRKSKD